MKTLEAHKDPHKEVSNQLFDLSEVTTNNHEMKQLSKNCWRSQSDLTEEVICLIVKHSALISYEGYAREEKELQFYKLSVA